MKTLEDGWYGINAYQFTVFECLRFGEIFLYYHNIILHVRAIPTLEFTNSMMNIVND